MLHAKSIKTVLTGTIVLLALAACEKKLNPVEPPKVDRLVINEVYTFADEKIKTNLDYIELYNQSDNEKKIGGMKLWESGGKERAFTIPAGKSMAANSFFIIECDKDQIDPINQAAWGLSKGADEWIVLADSGFAVLDSVKLPSLKVDESYGRKTDGADEWVIFSQRTKNASNNGKPLRQPVSNTIGLSVNEVFTNNQKAPVKPYAGVDWIELYNSSNSEINLEGYRLEDDSGDPAKAYTIPAGFVVPAQGFLVFDVKNSNTPAQGPVFGLGKGGDWVFIFNPAGTLMSEIEVPPLEDLEEYSCGRKPDGSTAIVLFTEATKGSSNNSAPVKP
jgi:hypothetical protein